MKHENFEKKINLLLVFAILSAGILTISNIVAVKLWDFFGIAVDGGIVIFPITYILGDIIVELYGEKRANFIVWLGFLLNIVAVLIFLLVGILPAYEGWNVQESYEKILFFTPRIVVGSLIAYLFSGLINNKMFEKIRKKTGEKHLWMRTLGSSFVAKIFDNIIFKTIAFYGLLSFPEFVSQLIFAYVASVVLEILLTPITYFVVGKLKKYGFSDFKNLA